MRHDIMVWAKEFIGTTLFLFATTTVAVGLLRYGGWLLSNSDPCPIAEVYQGRKQI